MTGVGSTDRTQVPAPSTDRDLLGRPVDSVEQFWQAHERGEPVVLLTSGSRGTPCPIIRTTTSWVDSFADYSRLTGITDTSRVWVPGPMDSTMNLFAAVQASWAGAAPADSLSSATHAQLTPAMLDRALGMDGLPPLTVIVAGATLGPPLSERARRAGLEVHHYYGAAELSLVAWGTSAADLAPFPGVEVRSRAGQLEVRSPYVSLGYRTPDVVGPFRRTEDDWCGVGDRGEVVDGRVRIHGRPGAVTTAGSTVELAPIQQELLAVAASTIALVALPHPALGEVLVCAGNDADDLARLRTWAHVHLDGARRPRGWYHLPDLPLTPAGKIDEPGVVREVLSQRTAGVNHG